MQAIHDRNGEPVGWLMDDIVYDTDDRYRAIVVDGAIFQLETSRFLGRLERGFLWDRNGTAVGCLEGAIPPPSIPELQPAPQGVDLATAGEVSVNGLVGADLKYAERWSQRSWIKFLAGD